MSNSRRLLDCLLRGRLILRKTTGGLGKYFLGNQRVFVEVMSDGLLSLQEERDFPENKWLDPKV